MPDLDQLARNFTPFLAAAEPAELVVLVDCLASELLKRKLPGMPELAIAAHLLTLHVAAQDAVARGTPIRGQDCSPPIK